MRRGWTLSALLAALVAGRAQALTCGRFALLSPPHGAQDVPLNARVFVYDNGGVLADVTLAETAAPEAPVRVTRVLVERDREVLLVPDAPLRPRTRYTVSTSSGTAIFTTGERVDDTPPSRPWGAVENTGANLAFTVGGAKDEATPDAGLLYAVYLAASSAPIDGGTAPLALLDAEGQPWLGNAACRGLRFDALHTPGLRFELRALDWAGNESPPSQDFGPCGCRQSPVSAGALLLGVWGARRRRVRTRPAVAGRFVRAQGLDRGSFACAAPSSAGGAAW